MAALLVGCSPAVAAAPLATEAPSASPRPTPPGLGRNRDVAVTFIPHTGAAALTESLKAELPGAWTRYTRGVGRVRVVPSGGITVFVSALQGLSWSYPGGSAPPTVVIYEYMTPPLLQANGTNRVDVSTLVHELGHVLGCCYGAGTSGGHFTGEPIGLMTEPRRCVCPFTDREMLEVFGVMGGD